MKKICVLLRSLVLSFGVVLIVVLFTPLVPWWAHELSGPFDNKKGDFLIVLGSAESADGILSYSSYLRCEYAVRAWHERWPRMILIIGGPPGPEPVSETMSAYIESQGVPAEIIWTETHSTSTRENALFTSMKAEELPGTKVLLTSDYHMYRARHVFEKVGIKVVPRPFPDAYKRGATIVGRWPAFLDLCEETLKIVYYRSRGWI